MTRKVLSLVASFLLLLPGLAAAAAPTLPNGTWRLFKDSDGRTPRGGAVIELTLTNGSFALKATQPGETVADSTFKPPALAVLAAEGCLNSPFRGFR